MPSRLFGTKRPNVPGLATLGQAGMKGEIADLRRDIEATFTELEGYGLPFLQEFIDLPAAVANAHMLSFATAASIQSFSRAAGTMTGAQTAEMVPPRNVTVTSTINAHVTALAVAIVGRVRDITGALIAQTDTINTTNGGGATDAGTKAFAFVDSISIPAMGGAAGSLTVGFGVVCGLRRKLKSAAGMPVVLQQITNGALVTNGTFVAAATSGPHGTWAPNSAANGTNDYALVYMQDAS